MKNRDKNVKNKAKQKTTNKKKTAKDSSDGFSIDLYTGSLSPWHEKLIIFRSCPVYVIYNKSHCLNCSPGFISLSFDLSLHSDHLCGSTLQLSILLILCQFPKNRGLSISNIIAWEYWLLSVYLWIQLLIPQHAIWQLIFLPLCLWKNSLSRMKMKRKNSTCYGLLFWNLHGSKWQDSWSGFVYIVLEQFLCII